jgi:hypothetical protein
MADSNSEKRRRRRRETNEENDEEADKIEGERAGTRKRLVKMICQGLTTATPLSFFSSSFSTGLLCVEQSE